MAISVTNKKTILITGAAKRIGRAIAEHFLKQGYFALLHAHHSCEELKSWSSQYSGRVEIITGDLSSELGQNQVVEQVKKSVESLDAIVHNASAFKKLRFSDISREAYRYMQAVNSDAPFFITQALVPLLKKSLKPAVVNIIDALWQRPLTEYAHYYASKAALVSITRSLAVELAPHIRVNGVAPGAIIFAPHHDETTQKRVIDRIPFKRLGSGEDIASAVFFVVEHAPYMTGEIINIDGGRAIAS